MTGFPDSGVMNDALWRDVFTDADTFVGAEDTIHAQLYHRLLLHGYSSKDVAREWRSDGHPYDVAVFAGGDGQFKTTSARPSAVFEVKGGAYNTRNALHDRITYDGYCDDHAYLAALPADIGERWFVCVDMRELGRAVRASGQRGSRCIADIAQQSSDRGISTAYFCQGENRFYVARPGQSLREIPLHATSMDGSESGLFDVLTDPKVLQCLETATTSITGHESNYTAYLYHLLRTRDFSPRQLSLETYFKFAPRQQRPDLTVYSLDYDGKFNLYPGGDNSRNNDLHKCQHLRGCIEVKAKQATKHYISDIEKLAQWRDVITNYYSRREPEMIFIAFDTRSRPMPEAELQDLVGTARANAVRLIYLNKFTSEVLV